MNEADKKIYWEVQKNAEMAMKAIDSIQEKLQDDALTSVLVRHNMEYEELRNKTKRKLLNDKKKTYRGTVWNDFLLKTEINMNTLLNTSQSHIAELMIQGNSRGLANIWRSLNLHGNSAKEALEVAEEFAGLEEKCIKELKKYL